MQGEGTCVSNWQRVTVFFDKRKVGQKKLGQWQEIIIEISKSCSCKMFQESGYNFLVQFILRKNTFILQR